jgi:hypothetical protein
MQILEPFLQAFLVVRPRHPVTPAAAFRFNQKYAVNGKSRSRFTWCNNAVNRSFFLCLTARAGPFGIAAGPKRVSVL